MLLSTLQTARSASDLFTGLHKRKVGGFALLITIVLVAFLVLILVGLAGLTRVETNVAANAQTAALARQNALTALQLALGDLQRFAGADQRATARADILVAGERDGVRLWTGVWGSATAPSALYEADPVPVFLNWLVSGNHTVSTPAVEAIPASAAGRITSAASTPPRRPDQVVSNLSLASALSDNLTVGGAPARLLVGPNTVGPGEVARYVVAPLETFSVPSALVPGAGTSGPPRPIGRYAYWIGDEGVKARFGLPEASPNPASGSPAWVASISAAPRAALETVTGFTDYLSANTPERVLDYGQIRFAQVALTPAAAFARFHDVSTHSLGLLTDSARGGLREDMDFHRANPAGFTGNLLPSALVTDSTRPQREKILDYMNLAGPGGVSAAGVVSIRPGSPSAQGLFPIVVASSQLVGARRSPTGRLFLHYLPVVVLANPWNVTLTGGVRFHIQHSDGSDNLRVFPASNVPAWVTPFAEYRTNLSAVMRTRLRIPSLNLAPGEARIYSLPAAGADAALSFPLVPSWGPPVPEVDLVNEFNPGVSLAIDTGRNIAPADFGKNITLRPIASGGGSLNLVLENLAGVELYRVAVMGHGGLSNFNFVPREDIIDLAETRGFRSRLKSAMETNAPANRDIRFLADYSLDHPVLRRAGVTDGVFSDNPVHRQITKNNSDATPYANIIEPLPLPVETARWGRAYDASGAPRLVLRHAPRADRPLLGVGQLRHADLATSSDEPALALGGSLASPFVARTAVSRTSAGANFYDASRLLNTALLDTYLISNLPATGTPFDAATDRLPFDRYVFPSLGGAAPTLAQLRGPGPRAFSARAAVEGAFNLNSTSVEAWKAQLAALRGLDYGAQTALTGPAPRTPFQPEGSVTAADPLTESAWAGFRNLSDADIQRLAQEIVIANRERGPALTFAHFANRALAAGPTGLRGRLQDAIENSGLNSAFGAGAVGSGGAAVVADGSPEALRYADVAHASGPVATGAPGWLSQSDLISFLAPAASTRSDTFLIRVYGETLNAVSEQPEARAWGEAVVQRLADFIEPGVAPELDTSALSTTSLTLGRRFHVVSFRWLTPADI